MPRKLRSAIVWPPYSAHALQVINPLAGRFLSTPGALQRVPSQLAGKESGVLAQQSERKVDSIREQSVDAEVEETLHLRHIVDRPNVNFEARGVETRNDTARCDAHAGAANGHLHGRHVTKRP